MKKYIIMALSFLGVTLGLVMARSQTTSTTVASVERLDPALDKIVSSGARLEKIASGFKWTEGPVWTRSGYLLFAEIPSNRIMKWARDGRVSVFLHPSGYQGSAPYGGPESGSNGMTLDRRGRLTVAGHARRNVFRLESLAPGAQLTVLAERYQGKRLNSPNDLAYRSDGSLYFTDPPYGLRTQSDNDPKKELSFNGVFRIPHALTRPAGAPPDDSKLQVVIKDLTRPNGIAFSPDGNYLYIAVSDPAHPVWMRYAAKADGSVTDGKVFCDASGDKRPGGPDGIKLDRAGNIYGSGPGGVWIISPEGKHLGTIVVPERMANCAWGDADGKTLYITASSSVYRIRLKMSGVRP
ncbi:MAG TPA: SMP-30/gluconolactonase/LRE family protein [Terriglobia bacterium]|nr:SMP-30/gluconolactonase/LRE family protein [Terriglobia bacterium]